MDLDPPRWHLSSRRSAEAWDMPGTPRVPLFRLSIRIDGAAGATAFVQAFLADIPGRRRLAWRALAD